MAQTAQRATALEIRKACNLTQHQMAIKLAIGLRTYERYEQEWTPERVLRHMELVLAQKNSERQSG